jgi:signal transduction histidine kinase/ActR/RegA family two-component response regulator
LAAIGRQDIVGKPLLEALPEVRDQGFVELLTEVMRSGVAHVGHETLVRLVQNGEPRDTYWTFIYAPLEGEDGRVDSVIALCNHVTEQVEARRRVEALAIEAASANRAKDEFLAMLGHELRNPLAPMLTALQLMRLRGHASREQDVLERQVSHLSRLVNDLLDVSRITRGRIELHRTQVELSEVVTRAVEVVSPLLEHSHHALEVQVPAQGLLLFADVGRLAQVVSNLLTNAVKYSDPHSRISVRAERAGAIVRICVRDHGIGIAGEMLDGIFEAFVQQPQSIERARGGLGLGLAIVRSLVEQHGGSVRAQSEGVGLGSEFIVELPAADDELGAVPPRRSTVPPIASDAELGKLVLVVDDNEDAAAMLKQALEELGYRVETAHDGPSALRIAAEFRPDIALLDIGLPVMDGYELAQRLRAESVKPPRLLAVTGYGQATDRQRSAAAGFEAHLVKPLDLERLERAMTAPPPKAHP